MKLLLFKIIYCILAHYCHGGSINEVVITLNEKLQRSSIPYKMDIFDVSHIYPSDLIPKGHKNVYILKMAMIDNENAGVVIGSKYWAENFWDDELYFDYSSFRAYLASVDAAKKNSVIKIFTEFEADLKKNDFISNEEGIQQRYLIFQKRTKE